MGDSTNGGQARAYQALRESEELHRATLSSISDAVFLTDDEGRFRFICPNVDVIFGYVPDEVQAMATIDRLLGEGLFDCRDLAVRHEIRNIEREVTAKSGERRVVLVHLKAVSIQGATALFTCRDITDRKRLEEDLAAMRRDLADASRLVLVGGLMASVAHDIGQPLTSILSNAGAALRQLDAGPPSDQTRELRECFADIRNQGRLASGMVDRLRTLARNRPLDLQPLDLNDVARDMFSLIRGDARRRQVALRLEFEPSLPLVVADRVCLQQVMLNLMLNAMDSMDRVQVDERQLIVRTRRSENAVEVSVSDSGQGIPAARLPRLFDAFFTTKEGGVGLGLAITRSIVEAHGGTIRAEDLDGRGAAFHVTLPLAAAAI
jgi:PAS domain S-box-containing protein